MNLFGRSKHFWTVIEIELKITAKNEDTLVDILLSSQGNCNARKFWIIFFTMTMILYLCTKLIMKDIMIKYMMIKETKLVK